MYDAGNYDIIVVGAGHAGCEAALACARMGAHTLLLTISMDAIALMACNPAIGGSSKGHLVREIDALGGEMGVCADATYMQIKRLNTAKGPAVHSLRAQMDKKAYTARMKYTLEHTDNLEVRQAEVASIVTRNGAAAGVVTTLLARFSSRAVILATGVYLKGRIYIGEHSFASGPSGLFPANSLSASLSSLGFELRRFKTGTPARVDARSVDLSRFEEQRGEEGALRFSFLPDYVTGKNCPCYLGYTNARTHEVIRANIDRSPLYSGTIEGIGPRYCPSIEDKVVKFPDKERHQFFLEPEGEDSGELYVQGMSSSLPEEVQVALYRTIDGFENVRFTRTAYAIEYDCIDPTKLKSTLETKYLPGLFTAGQINGTSGYEEAAAQGIVAGINAIAYLRGEEPLIIGRDEGYTGVLIDDLVTRGTNEPYRMMTARAEYRLLLRQDNADFRLTEYGRRHGLVTDGRYDIFMRRAELTERLVEKAQSAVIPQEEASRILSRTGEEAHGGMRAAELLRRPGVEIADIAALSGYPEDVAAEACARIKYAGYIEKQRRQVEKQRKLEDMAIPADIDYPSLSGIRLEARQKLSAISPRSVGQAARISGVSPADISVLIVHLERLRRERADV